MPIFDPKLCVHLRDMRVDDVDGGLPKVTFDMREMGGDVRTYALAPDAVRGLVDALAGVADPAPGEIRVIVKMSRESAADALPVLYDRGVLVGAVRPATKRPA